MSRAPTKDDQKETLERFIALSENSRLNESEITDYLQAFSTYLCKKDAAYYYNYSFLVQQNSEFQEFLNQAATKRTALVNFVVKMNQLTQFKTLLGYGGSSNSVEVTMNNLWRIDAASGKCSLIEDFSVSGAACGQSGDIITLRYSDCTYSFPPTVDDQYLNQIVEILLNTAAEKGDTDE